MRGHGHDKTRGCSEARTFSWLASLKLRADGVLIPLTILIVGHAVTKSSQRSEFEATVSPAGSSEAVRVHFVMEGLVGVASSATAFPNVLNIPKASQSRGDEKRK
jgi:hypothetical protein